MPLPARRRASKVSRAQPPSAQTGTRVSARSGIRRGAMKRERVCADVKGSPSGLSSRNYRGRETFAYYEWRCMRDGDAHDKPAQRIRILDLLLNCSHYAGLHGSVFSLLPVSPRGSATGVERRSGPGGSFISHFYVSLGSNGVVECARQPASGVSRVFRGILVARPG